MEKEHNREIHSTRTFQAPLRSLWEVWTQPGHIAKWWGPNGFTNSIHTMDFVAGGEWNSTMHGPDGTNYPNKSVFKEIIPFKKIVFEHFHPDFRTTVLFTSLGEETRIDWTLQFNTAEMRETVIKAHKADEGQKQNLVRLEKYLVEMKK